VRQHYRSPSSNQTVELAVCTLAMVRYPVNSQIAWLPADWPGSSDSIRVSQPLFLQTGGSGAPSCISVIRTQALRQGKCTIHRDFESSLVTIKTWKAFIGA
jgi:hypothetical protein